MGFLDCHLSPRQALFLAHKCVGTENEMCAILSESCKIEIFILALKIFLLQVKVVKKSL